VICQLTYQIGFSLHGLVSSKSGFYGYLAGKPLSELQRQVKRFLDNGLPNQGCQLYKTINLHSLADEISVCTMCQDTGLIPEARPIFQLPATATVGLFSQAPGNLAHQTGLPFMDPSGVRLRSWLGVNEEQFYRSGVFAIAPMAFCFPGYDGSGPTGKGGDLPPVEACAEQWRSQLMEELMPRLDVVLLIGQHAQRWHMPQTRKLSMTARVGLWQDYLAERQQSSEATRQPLILPLPHPSWRNTSWLKKNPWFKTDLLPVLRTLVADSLAAAGNRTQ
jgi:uracil-DNA glycosylase